MKITYKKVLTNIVARDAEKWITELTGCKKVYASTHKTVISINDLNQCVDFYVPILVFSEENKYRAAKVVVHGFTNGNGLIYLYVTDTKDVIWWADNKMNSRYGITEFRLPSVS